MSIPKEQLINAIVIGLGAIFLAKLFAPFFMTMFRDVFTGKKPKSSGSNIEAMIAHKEAMLRRGENIGSKGGVNNAALEAGIKNKKSGKSQVELRYMEQLEILKKAENEELVVDTQKILSLFESMQWGEGQALAEVRGKFNKKFGTAPEQRVILNNLKNLIKREIPIARDSKKLPEFREITDLILAKTFLQGFCMEDNFSKDLAKSVARKMRISPASVLKSVAALLAKESGQNEQKRYPTILISKNPFSEWDLPAREKLVNASLISKDKKYFITVKELIELITSEAHLFHTLSPLPKLQGKNDITGALAIFGLTEGCHADEIKKTYKKLSMLKHPDRLASKGIPKTFEDIAHENITTLQGAYEILKKG